jgi:sec-independent protein translocase protein TatC
MPKSSPKEMPFLDHLEELRKRLFWILGSLIVGTLLGFWILQHFNLMNVLQMPIRKYLDTQGLVILNPSGAFRILMYAAFVIGAVVAMPVVLYQIWAFLSPGLHAHEKRIAMPVIAAGSLLFASGVALCYFKVLPVTLGFLLGLGKGWSQQLITADAYFSFAANMALAFGVVFELPIVVVGLTVLGIVTPKLLTRFRRHAIVVLAVGSAVLTPSPDAASMLALLVPLYLLYEVSIVCSFVIYRRREKRREREAQDAAQEAAQDAAREAAEAQGVEGMA